MIPNKVCPVVLRVVHQEIHILAFEHPQAGRQLVKGTIEPGEDPAEAAGRELWEESGLKMTIPPRPLGVWEAGFAGQIWSFWLCQLSQPAADQWQHWCQDDNGHQFTFFWHPLLQKPDERWHPLFQNALYQVRHLLQQEGLLPNT
jgi:8-oxo-dGTP pyrophosphatase MutT (NUDIX family)